MIRADFLTSAVLLALGLATIAEAWRMPRFAEVGSSFWSAPGVVPGMLGAALSILAVILCFRSVSARRAGAVDTPAGEPGAWGRIATVLALCLAYAAILVGRVPFWLATFLFVFAFVSVFELSRAEARPRWPRHALIALCVAALTSATVSYVFQNLFLVRLP